MIEAQETACYPTTSTAKEEPEITKYKRLFAACIYGAFDDIIRSERMINLAIKRHVDKHGVFPARLEIRKMKNKVYSMLEINIRYNPYRWLQSDYFYGMLEVTLGISKEYWQRLVRERGYENIEAARDAAGAIAFREEYETKYK